MDRLFTPWRLAYVTEASRSDPGCIFCDALARIDTEPLVVYRGRRTFVILNKYPYNNGHVMVVPHRHTGELGALEIDEHRDQRPLERLVDARERRLPHVRGDERGDLPGAVGALAGPRQERGRRDGCG